MVTIMVTASLIVVIACPLLVWLPGQTTARPHHKSITTLIASRETAAAITMFTSRVFNLDVCEPGIRIEMMGKRLNKRNLRLTSLDALNLVPMAHEESLTDRMYVWCRTAELYASLRGVQQKSFEVKALNYFQGDIFLTREDVDLSLAPYSLTRGVDIQASGSARNNQRRTPNGRVKRKIVAWRNQHWPNATIPYSIDTRLSRRTRNSIAKAIGQWEEDTCIKFRERDKLLFKPHLYFQKWRKGDNWCSSELGFQPYGQSIIIGTGCEVAGVISHEIGHALGFYHEQARPDRDMYVDIIKENIESGVDQFSRIKWDSGMTLGVPYDYSSLMHYRSTDFGLDHGRKTTIRAKDLDMQKVMGQRQDLSFLDIKLANINYCSHSCSTGTLDWSECKHEGYRNPNDCNSCVCPRGLAPPRCEYPSKGVNDNCGEQVLTATKADNILKTPGYDSRRLGFNGEAFCPWLIKAATLGKRVRLQFTGRFHFTEDDVLCGDYAEVRYKDVSRTGPRLCGKIFPKRVFRSHGPEMFVSAKSLVVSWWQGFKAIYAEENCGGCSSDASRDEPTCMRTVKYDCSPPAVCMEEPCPIPRKNHCYRDEEYCCESFRRIENRCLRNSLNPPRTAAMSWLMTTTTATIPSTSRPTTPRSTVLTSQGLTVRTPGRPTIPATRTPSIPTTRRSTLLTAKGPISRTSRRSNLSTTKRPTARAPSRPTILTTKRSTTAATTITTTVNPPEILQTTSPVAWSAWSAWTDCAGTCGSCGQRSRTRACRARFCNGSAIESEACDKGVTANQTSV